MAVCKSAKCTISEGETHPFVASAPLVLYSVIVANESTSAPALAGIYNGASMIGYMDFAVPPGETVVWTGCVALPKGMSAVAEVGAVRVTVMYV